MTDQTVVATTRAGNPHAYEGWSQKFKRKFNENPWVPLGCLATVGALVMSAVKMRSGQAKQMNYWMRARVGLQGVTLVALVAGTMALQKKEKEEGAAGAVQSMTAEQARQQEKEEFEERMRNAEATYEQEKVFAEGAAVRRAKAVAASLPGPPAVEAKGSLEKVDTPASSGKSWWKLW
ncbi:altered inheritance of mitochondria protein 31, mitochondrial [Coprinopsis sp. MPI-PUGE-AT-0042]|nr:altered inheritance of mitochondria protein 31, mitochondrial [Coprinopsis sp. MPI-PUGE-AT-0042]